MDSDTLVTSIVWFRSDLRLADNPALRAAIARGGPVVPLFVWSPEEESPWAPGGASSWWLHESLKSLDAALRAAGSRVIIRSGPVLDALLSVAKESGAGAVFWNRRYEPAIIARDSRVKEVLRADGLAAESFNAALLHEPWTIKNRSVKPFQVFTPFWRHCTSLKDPREPLPSPREVAAPGKWPKSLALQELGLAPKIDWTGAMRAAWQPGEAGAKERLREFVGEAFADYPAMRDKPGIHGTSRLSPHLHFGEIGPRQVWHAIARAAEKRGGRFAAWRDSRFLAEVGWREFAHHLLFHFPHTTSEPLREDFKRFPWRKDIRELRAWQKGMTGFPIVDAGMRELWATGWMHNRVRMIVASFLVKDLLIHWRDGAAWFWDTLVDADLANNTLGWQWTSGCGADAAPYFRIFNPVSQGGKFDPDGAYVRRWCPELAKLPAKWIHQPDVAPAEVLRIAGVELGRNYPEPIVSHSIARHAALDAFSRLKQEC